MDKVKCEFSNVKDPSPFIYFMLFFYINKELLLLNELCEHFNVNPKNVIPAIRDNISFLNSVTIQQDNAKPHIGKNNVSRLNEQGAMALPYVTVSNQPAQSPEFNLDDLGFFHSLSKKCLKSEAHSLDELWTNVQQTYWDTDIETLNSLWTITPLVLNSAFNMSGGYVNIKHN